MRIARIHLVNAVLGAVLLAALPASSSAQTYTENFNAPGAAWESGWFGVNSDAVNYYCQARGCSDRGDAPTALWYSGSPINFLSGFGNNISSLSIGLGAFTPTNFQVYDSSDNLIFDEAVAVSNAYADGPNYVVTSTNGISRFELTGSAGGNVTLDNIVVTKGVTSTPEPATATLLATGLVGLCGVARRKCYAARAA